MGVAERAKVPGSTSDKTPWLICVLVLIVALLPERIVLPGPLHANGAPARLIATALAVLVAIGFATGRTATDSRKVVRPGVLIMVLYLSTELLVWGVGVSKHVSPDSAAVQTPLLATLALTVGLAIYVMTHVNTSRQISVVLAYLAIGLVASCVVALLQSGGVDLQYVFQPPGFILNPLGDQGIGLPGKGLSIRSGSVRASGTQIGPLDFTVCAAITVPLCLHFARSSASPRSRSLALCGAVISLVAVPTSGSRTGVVALAACLSIYVWALPLRNILSTVISGFCILLIGAVASPKTANALWIAITTASSSEDPSIESRATAITRVSATFREHPIFGLGSGGTLPKLYGFIDNQWLSTLAAGGIVGIGGLLLMLAAVVFGLASALRIAQTPKERSQAYAIGAMAFAILISGFTFDILAFQSARYIFVVLVGLLWCRIEIPTTHRNANPNLADQCPSSPPEGPFDGPEVRGKTGIRGRKSNFQPSSE